MSQPPKKPKASGASRRKEKERQLLCEAARKTKPIKGFFTSAEEADENASTSISTSTPEQDQTGIETEIEGPVSAVPSFSLSLSEAASPTDHSINYEEHHPELDQQQQQHTRANSDYEDVSVSASDTDTIIASASLASPTNTDHVSNDEFFMPCFKSKLGKQVFFEYHETARKSIPEKYLFRKDGTERKFLSYDDNKHAFYCCTCLAFCGPTDKSSFITGFPNDPKHNNSRIIEHERSNSHNNYVAALISFQRESNVSYLVTRNMADKMRADVAKRHEVLIRLIEIIKFIGKRGLSYRGSQESAASLLEEDTDHGNYLELVKLLSKFDPVLKQHLTRCVEEGERRSGSSKGRGSTITFLSKTSANYIFEALHELMMELISDEVKEAQMYSIQIDTCQDVSVKEQLSLILRYVKDGRVFETFAGFLECTSTTGKSLFDLVQSHLIKYKIDVKNCIGSATDGASNMRGQFNGFQANLSVKSPEQVHVWCFSHVLNLVLTDVCKSSISVIDLFDSLSEAARMVKESYKRTNLFKSLLAEGELKRLQIIANTRWWSSERALTNVFGPFGDPSKGLYVPLVVTLHALANDSETNSVARSKANGILGKLIKAQTLLAAHLFLQIFKVTTPLSNYLQTRGLDIVQANRMVATACHSLTLLNENKKSVFEQAKNFVSHVNDRLEATECDFKLNLDLPIIRQRRRKRFFDEESIPPDGLSPIDRFNIEVVSKTFESVISLLREKFSKHADLAKEFHLLDPRNFGQLKDGIDFANTFSGINQKLKNFYPSYDENCLAIELVSFAANWPKFKIDEHQLYEEELKISMQDDFDETIETDDISIETDLEAASVDDANSDIDDFDTNVIDADAPPFARCSKDCFSEKGCVFCCFRFLVKYNMYSMAYKNLYLVYKYMLTLSLGQVECERSFSKMKYLKNRLRSSLSQSNFVHISQIYCERRLLVQIDNKKVIEKLSQKSRRLGELLTIK